MSGYCNQETQRYSIAEAVGTQLGGLYAQTIHALIAPPAAAEVGEVGRPGGPAGSFCKDSSITWISFACATDSRGLSHCYRVLETAASAKCFLLLVNKYSIFFFVLLKRFAFVFLSIEAYFVR